MGERLKILVLIKELEKYPKHKPKIEIFRTLENYADVYYWHEDGHINKILQKVNVKPDFIFHQNRGGKLNDKSSR